MAKQGTSAHELDDMNATDIEARLREAVGEEPEPGLGVADHASVPAS